MANSNKPFGLMPHFPGGRAASGPRLNWYPLAASNQIMARGDLALLNTAGTVDRYGTSNTGAITANTYGTTLGVIAGFRPTGVGTGGAPNVASDGSVRDRTYVPASLAGSWEVGVYDDPDQLFAIQGDDTTALDQACVGAVGDLVSAAATSFSAVAGRSNFTLDSSTLVAGTATNAYMFIVRALRRAIGDDYSSTSGGYTPLVVQICSHRWAGNAFDVSGATVKTPGI